MNVRSELRLFRILTSVFLGLAACSIDEQESGGPGMGLRLRQPRSFTVHGTLTSGREHDFVLRIDPVAMTMLVDGSTWQAQTTDGVTFRAASPPGVEMTVFAEGCARETALYERFSVSLAGDRLTGTAAGLGYHQIHDTRSSHDVEAQFTGVVDTVAPSLGGDRLDFDPLASLVFGASEALPANAVAMLVAGTETIDLKVFGGSDVVTGFYADQVALRYATTYQLVVSPWMDLAENPGGALAKVLTRAPPPLIGEDGFETASASVGGGLVVAADVITPSAGARSLLIQGVMGPLTSVRSPNSNRVTVRLPVAAGDRAVRFSIRPVLHRQNQSSARHGQFRVAVPGGAMVRAALPDVLAEATSGPHQSAGTSYWLGDVMPVEIALPSGAGSEVIFDAQVPSDQFDNCGIPDLREGYLIDDLRVE